MPCSYCGANLTIPNELRTQKQTPPVEFKPLKGAPAKSPKPEAVIDTLQKAEPLLIKAWNTYAAWTWVKWLFPTCLTLFILGCVAMGMMLLFFTLSR